MAQKTIRLALVGFGNAGQEFCRLLLSKQEELEQREQARVLITGISTASKGTVMNSEGLDLATLLLEIETAGAFAKDRVDLDTFGMIDAVSADCLVELSPLSIADGEPAISHIEKAFGRGLHVVTANKGPVVWRYKELCAMAEKSSRMFLYETTVLAGAPLFNLVRETLRGCAVLSFRGVLNLTTNLILEEMGEKGVGYEEALKEVQRQGFAEADPTMDVDGHDAAVKTAILLNVLMDGRTNPSRIKRTGITSVRRSDIVQAREKGGKIKLLCRGYRENGVAVGSVEPTFLPLSDTFAFVGSSGVTLETDVMGKLTIMINEPKLSQVSYGIYIDVLTLLDRI
ncbi:hypothetical protein LJC34_04285 [Oscillospiraceae bacterium OttesenSCG-928-G22]|nr:hypothetical protein [Oscillospiraceae bacterium OttesenSCG-928-G22]